MSFKVKDANRFKKGLDEADQKKWADVANKALSKLTRKKVPLLEAEQTAIRQANAMFGDKQKVMKFKEMEDTTISIMLADAKASDDMQLILPTGTTFSRWYGALMFTENFMKAMVKNSEVLKSTDAFLDENHDRGKALAWPEEVKSSEDGLLVKWDFTSLGRQLVEDKIYKYFSAEIGSSIDVDTGERVYPVLLGCALTNSPVMKNLSNVHLHEVAFKEETLGGKEVKDFKEIMEALADLTLSDEEKATLLEAYKTEDSDKVKLAEKLKDADKTIVTLNETIVGLEADLVTFADAKVEAKLSEAMKAGKITPADKETWKTILSSDFEKFSAIIDKLAVVVELDENGVEVDNNDVTPKHKSSDYTGQKQLSTGSKNSADYTGGAK